MSDSRQLAAELVKKLNAWAWCDRPYLKPAAVTSCELKSLPDDPADADEYIAEEHQSFFWELADALDRCRSIGETVFRDVVDFDPTEKCDYSRAPDDPSSVIAKAAAKQYFQGRKIDFFEGSGAASFSGYSISYDHVIALDSENQLIFSFIWNLHDHD